MVVLETWWDFFLKNMFLNPKRKLKPVLVPCVLKTPENKRDLYLLANFALLNSR